MNTLRTTKMAFKSIMHNKMRSFLTMLGIIIGVCSVITLVSVIQGMQRETLKAYAHYANRITVYYDSYMPNVPDISDAFYEECASLSKYIVGATSSSSQNMAVKYKSKTLSSARVALASDTYDAANGLKLSQGRSVSYSDVKNKVKVCVMGSYPAKEFFGLENPIGKKIKIGGVYYTVIGTYESQYGDSEWSDDNVIAVPRSCGRSLGISERNGFTVKCRDAESTDLAMFHLRTWLKNQLPENAYSDVYSDNSWREQEQKSMDMFALVVGGIAGISLLVGGIGIMNIMLVSVSERTREIGIRMSIGAKRRDIITQFLIEASVISACGGVIGIIIGALGSAMLSSAIFKKVYLPSPLIAIGAFAFSVALGIFFGFYPANKASKMQPVEALRNN